MKVKAKHWVNYDGILHQKDEVFEVATTDMDEMLAYVELVEEPVEPRKTRPKKN